MASSTGPEYPSALSQFRVHGTEVYTKVVVLRKDSGSLTRSFSSKFPIPPLLHQNQSFPDPSLSPDRPLSPPIATALLSLIPRDRALATLVSAIRILLCSIKTSLIRLPYSAADILPHASSQDSHRHLTRLPPITTKSAPDRVVVPAHGLSFLEYHESWIGWEF
ncbi:hypothetical protein JAAARDRAFT_200995 [Jaapia argillacea MUCL 33604]|uniref:Uncharacterized protein n=1 Tax=Jaapia argillacea MUCL 33604 TaxID=933084 RepID=A0A067P2Y8_9AGAM|nr:hypothetical protein JAAARDRAFT_200995 [Jaapia argillacea MUCL 33604]